MLDVAWPELVVIGAVALVAIGPKDLPKAMHTLGIWAGKLRRFGHNIHQTFDQLTYEAEIAERLKNPSLSRRLEWDRLAQRDSVRPDFHVFTGNDLAIDMVRYGSDWLLGLSTAAPDAFAKRDQWWAAGDSRFDELDDALQSLGDFAFRRPVPAYKHSMAQALHLRGLIAGDEPHPDSPRRPESDRAIIATILERIDRASQAAA